CFASITVSNVDNGSFDPDGSIVSRTLTPPGPYPKGTNLVTLTVVDNRGASNSCIATIVIIDTTPPTIMCPAPVTVQCDSAVPLPNPASVIVTDNCDPAPAVVFVSDVATGACPKTITRTYRATDNSGNTNFCTQIITVRDTNAPVISG